MIIKHSRMNYLLGLLPPAIIIIIWEFLVRLGYVRQEFFPKPSEVFWSLVEITESGELFNHLSASLIRVFSGYLIGITLAIPLGIMMGCSKRLSFIFRPIIEMLRTVSPIAWIPLAILWFGIGNTPAIFIIAITCFFPMAVATINAVYMVNPLYRKIARNFGASKWQEISTVIIPATLPIIFVGLRISLGIAWLVIVAAEMVGMRSGLGYLIMDSRNLLRTDLVIACMIVIGLVGFLLDSIMQKIEQSLQGKSKTAEGLI